ncbi:MAG: cobyric acid synthase [Euryarchaeota archaeon]|nr:cobyric acid synthase [Euryarchaeota archaeon]
MKGSIMFQAVCSSAGKSTLTAALCRHLARKGIDVAPFKAQNLSLNSFVTEDGGEMGISQAFQAWACGIEPDVDMNPILLKPKGEGGMQIVLHGRPLKDIDQNGERADIGELLGHVSDSFSRIKGRHDVIVIEGSGSPAEINLRGRDVANMATAKIAGSPVILIGDIDKGGVFAGLYGTYNLLDESERAMVKGFIINRFRGDASILGPGIERLESEMSCPCLGVMPYARLRSPAEDSMEIGKQEADASGGDVREVWLRSLDDFTDVFERSIDMLALEELIEKGP